MKKLLLSVLFATIPTTCFAQWTSVNTRNVINADVNAVKIVFMSRITPMTAVDLMSTIDSVNLKYKNAKHIYLYMESLGGDVDSAIMIYKDLKSSKIPVTTINVSNIVSAGNIIFCGGSTREAFKNAHFVLHPMAWDTDNKVSITPAKAINYTKLLQSYQDETTPIYQSCTTIPEHTLNRVFYSDGNRDYLTTHQAKKYKLIENITTKMVQTPVVYYVNN